MLEIYVLYLAVLYFQLYLKILQGGKNMVAFCSTVQKPHWLFCDGGFDSRHSEQWVDFKIESVLQARRKKIIFYIYLANEEMGAATVDSR